MRADPCQHLRFTDIGVTLDGHIATIEIQRPPHNFFDFSLIGQIADAFSAMDEDPQCRAIVLAAQGKSFCAGANFGSGRSDGSGSADFTEEGFRNTTGKLYREAVRLFSCKKPVVGAIQGPRSAAGSASRSFRIFVSCRPKRGSPRISRSSAFIPALA